ncbi:MAG: amidophosphoribosyltransferase [Clostridia bacterium]|nr:amidophosphoribosyltransferase [Clostridia bacterium]
MTDKLHEECGLFAMFDNDGYDTARITYAGLFAMQHRGQQSAGIAVNNDRKVTLYKDNGLVHEVFSDEVINSLKGRMAIGHVRYSADGEQDVLNAQPLVSRYIKGPLAVATNGTLTNYHELKHQLEQEGAIFQTTNETEIIMHLLARARMKTGRVETGLAEIMKNQLRGAYALVMMSPQKLIACRDPKGMKPLCMGKIENSYVFASETCALDTVRAEFVRELDPGEIVIVDVNGVRSIRDNCQDRKCSSMCVFEYLYFARSDSIIEGMSVHKARKLTGKILSETYPVDADIVAAVPDSGVDAAIGYAEASGIPYAKALMINRYVGRTFIQPTQEQRTTAVRLKINVIRDTVKDKKIVLVDDSIVRGTTCAKLVAMLKEAGAKEVHMRISAPPFIWPCYFGTDIPSREHLMACNYTVDEICNMIGADSLGFMPVERLPEVVPDINCGYCDGCFTGKYPYEHE